MIQFLASNWLWIALIVFFVAMHRGGHGCGMHGRHGGHGDHQHGEQAGTHHVDADSPALAADSDEHAPDKTAHGF